MTDINHATVDFCLSQVKDVLDVTVSALQLTFIRSRDTADIFNTFDEPQKVNMRGQIIYTVETKETLLILFRSVEKKNTHVCTHPPHIHTDWQLSAHDEHKGIIPKIHKISYDGQS